MPIYKGDTPIVEASGRKGADGTNGQDGINGENGATYTPSISEDGILSWTNDKNLPNPEPVNIKGQDGVSYTLTKSEDGTKIILTGSDGSVQEILDSNTIYSEATQTESGLMSAEDKAKLDNMSSGSDPKPVTITRTVIFEGNAYQLSNLSNPLSNFDFIEIAYKMRFGGMQVVSITPVESMLSEINGEKGYYLAPFLLSNNEMYFGDAHATKFTNNTLIYTSNSNTIRVVGIKLSI